jgi:hypothetical protein
VRFAPLRDLAIKVRHQQPRQRGPKAYSLHVPEVECIGKGKARIPYEFGCKVSIVTPVTAPKGGQFVLHAKALHGNPFDGHTLAPVIADLERLTSVATRRVHVDKGYRGHNHPDKFRVFISGQVRRVTAAIRRQMKRRAAVERVIGTSKLTTAWTATSSRVAKAIAPTQSSPGWLQLPPTDPLAGGAFECLVAATVLRPLPAGQRQTRHHRVLH